MCGNARRLGMNFYVASDLSFFQTCKFCPRLFHERPHAPLKITNIAKCNPPIILRSFCQGCAQHACLQDIVLPKLAVSVRTSLIHGFPIRLEIPNRNQHVHNKRVTCLVSRASPRSHTHGVSTSAVAGCDCCAQHA